jgi:2-polyprenyl-3-methyl-5-hydroxy-6-metoxy-1,4-benzoquinol methylase
MAEESATRPPMTFDPPLAACPVCEAAAPDVQRWGQKDRVGQTFLFDRCARCGFVFVNPRPTVQSLIAHYTFNPAHVAEPVVAANELERERYWPNATRAARRLIGTMLKLRPAPGTPGSMLDIGSGSGFFAREAVRRGLSVTALELDETSRQCTREIAAVEPINVAFEDYTPSEPSFRGFDYILMSQVLEHAHDVNAWVAKAARLLTSGGVLAIALPNFDSIFRRLLAMRDPFFIPPEHLNYFNRRSLSRLCEKHGLRVAEMQDNTQLPRDLLAKRLPKALRVPGEAMGVIMHHAVNAATSITRCGMFLSVYAVK